ncbi:hypothetical protein M427DRAFT_495463 [Gonapodya prolifera JEL478]|uniref:Uncharacterized protein n=1 Tax=Gonapodya prolifera (strain JEL478) TaxID=1344416 RepID=A0A138ZWI0_GONPJ|nr:hypothetical protein M427DRAFT_495463 [Gonapodya prolifera JEL478]|eukprot:KXS08804.1 hypothetical protein M427DRAFT_495463 [Gonapodya prolifera JEL478]
MKITPGVLVTSVLWLCSTVMCSVQQPNCTSGGRYVGMGYDMGGGKVVYAGGFVLFGSDEGRYLCSVTRDVMKAFSEQLNGTVIEGNVSVIIARGQWIVGGHSIGNGYLRGLGYSPVFVHATWNMSKPDSDRLETILSSTKLGWSATKSSPERMNLRPAIWVVTIACDVFVVFHLYIIKRQTNDLPRSVRIAVFVIEAMIFLAFVNMTITLLKL